MGTPLLCCLTRNVYYVVFSLIVVIAIVTVLGNALFLVRKHLCKWKNHSRFDLDEKFVRDRILNKSWRGRRCFSEKAETPISCSNGTGEDPFIPVNKKLSDARVIYAVAPAMGHNKVPLSWSVLLF